MLLLLLLLSLLLFLSRCFQDFSLHFWFSAVYDAQVKFCLYWSYLWFTEFLGFISQCFSSDLGGFWLLYLQILFLLQFHSLPHLCLQLYICYTAWYYLTGLWECVHSSTIFFSLYFSAWIIYIGLFSGSLTFSSSPINC